MVNPVQDKIDKLPLMSAIMIINTHYRKIARIPACAKLSTRKATIGEMSSIPPMGGIIRRNGARNGSTNIAKT
jgi:hypothetical protein